MRRKRTLFVTQAAMIAALYVVLTLIANMFGLANYAIQVRFSESSFPHLLQNIIVSPFLNCIYQHNTTSLIKCKVKSKRKSTPFAGVPPILFIVIKLELLAAAVVFVNIVDVFIASA